MWPGLVGKGPGRRAADRSRHDARPDGRRRGGRRASSTASICSCSIRTSASTRPTTTSSGWPTRSRRASWSIGSLVAPVWPPTGGGSAMGSDEERKNVPRRRCARPAAIAQEAARARRPALRRRPHRLGLRARATGRRIRPATRRRSPRRSARRATSPSDFGERLAAEGEICWGGMHSWRRNVELLEMVDRPKTLGFQADMAHTLLFTLGYNAPEDRILPEDFDWNDQATLDEALKTMTRALRPWTIDFHVAQNDAHGQRLRLARQDRPALPAERSERQARHRPRTPATGCATTTGKLDEERSRTSAGTAACSPTRR